MYCNIDGWEGTEFHNQKYMNNYKIWRNKVNP